VVQALGKLDGCSQQSLCLIPARAGSKGLPGKNTREFHGKSLLSWTVESAIASRVFNEIAVTTDDPEVKKIAKSFGVTVLDRPIELAQDASLASDYLKYHSQLIKKFEFMMLLQVTSPLRNTHDIQESFRVLTESNDEDTVLISLTREGLRPSTLFFISQDGYAQSLIDTTERNRQDEKDLFRVNGAIFAAKTLTLENLEYEFLKGKVKAYIMPQERSVDIDTLMDFNRAKDLFDVERKN
jgi:CMP-N,N'-diacetyllegionaminic acid synthase